MPQLTKDQRVWICVEYARTNNVCEVIRRWPVRWYGIPVPSRLTIKSTFEKFVREGTCLNLNKGRSGRLRTARTQQNVDVVQQSLMEDGIRSARRNGLGLSRSNFNRIVKMDIKFHPYPVIRRHQLREGDPQQRLAFCNRFVNKAEQHPDFLDHLIVSDEAIFSLNSEINSRNVIKYATRLIIMLNFLKALTK